MNAPLPIDELIGRLRARAADPERRTAAPPSELTATIRTLDLGSLLELTRSVGADLRRVVEANQDGRVDVAGTERGAMLGQAMATPAASVLPGAADDKVIARAESAIGVALPSPLRRVYAEVADGGFGPGEGLLSLDRVVVVYRELREPDAMPRGRSWPDGLLPLVSMDPGWDCVDAASGRVVAWDPEDLSEHSSEAVFERSFRALFPSVEAWLSDWVGSRTQAEAQAAMMAHVMSSDYQVQQAREARAAIGRKTPAERAAMGLPETGWERVVWGGLGWDPDEDEGAPPA